MATTTLMSVEEFLALPDDGTERMLIRGELWERDMTRRNRFHSRIEARVAYLLVGWLEAQPTPRGQVYSGEAGCQLTEDSVVGIDVCYVSPETAAKDTETTLIPDPPVLAVEVLSPSDKHDEVHAKIKEYLAAGVAMVWLVDPYFETVTVHRPGQSPELFHGEAPLPTEPLLPGLRIQTRQIFAQ